MDRRNFLKGVTAATAATAAGSQAAKSASTTASHITAPQISKSLRQLKAAVGWPNNGQGFADFADQFAARMSNMTDGRLSLTFEAVNQVGDAAAAIDDFDGIGGLDAALRDDFPAVAFFSGLPGRHGLSGRALAAWLQAGDGQALYDELAGQAGFRPLIVAHSGAPSLLWAKTELVDASSLNGRRIWVQGLARDVAAALGAEPLTVAANEVQSPFSNPDAGFADVPGYAASVAMKQTDASHFLYEPGFYRHGVSATVGFRLETWHRLSTAEQSVITAAAAATFSESLAWADKYTPLMRQAVGARTSLRALPVELAAAIERVSDAIIAHAASQTGLAARINAHYMRALDSKCAEASAGLV